MNTFKSEAELLYNEKLIEAAVETIINDCRVGDFTAIYELLDRVDEDTLAAFIPVEKLREIRG